MIDAQNKLLFTTSPSVIVASVTFNTQVVIQYFDTPMLEVVQEITTLNQPGYTTKIPIFYNDGTQLAVAKGSQLYPTEDGNKVGVTMRYLPDVTVCELKGQPVFEIRRKGAAAVSMTAELFTNDGSFLKWAEDSVSGLLFNNPAKPFQAIQRVSEGGGLRIGFPGGGTVILNPGCSITAAIGILIGTPTQRTGGVGIHLAVPG